MNKQISLILIFLQGLLSFTLSAQQITPVLQTGHSKAVSFVKIQGSKYLISGGQDERVIFWDLQSQQQLAAIYGFKGQISCLDYHDSGLLVIGTYDNQVYVYDLDSSSFDPQAIYEFEYYVTSVAISPDARYILAASADYSLNVIKDFGTERVRMRSVRFNGDVVGLDFHRDSRKVYVGTYDGDVYELDLEVPVLLKITPIKRFNAGTTVSDLALSSNGRYLAYGTVGVNGNAGILGVFDLKRNRIKDTIMDFAPTLGVHSNSIHFGSDQLLLYKDHKEQLGEWNFKRNRRKTHELSVGNGFSLSANREWLAYTDQNSCKMIRWKKGGKALVFKGYVDAATRFVGQKGKQLLVEYASGIKEWDLEQLHVDMLHDKYYEHKWSRFDYSQDLNTWADEFSIRWKEDNSYTYHRFGEGKVSTAAFSPKARFFSYMSTEGKLVICDLRSIKRELFLPDSLKYSIPYDRGTARSKTTRIIYAPHKNEMVVLSGVMDVYDLDSMKIATIKGSYRNADFSLPAVYNPNDGYFLSAIRRSIRDTMPYEGHPDFSPEWRSTSFQRMNGKTSYQNVLNGVVYLWDLQKKEFPLYLIRHKQIDRHADVRGLLYDPHDTSIIIGYSDGHIAVLDAASPSYRYKLLKRATVSGLTDVLLSDDGHFLFVMMTDGSVNVLDRKSLELRCRLVALKDNEFIVMDAQGYYKRSKNTSNAIAFWHAGGLSKLSQYDKHFNQPHRVMGALGFVKKDKLQMIQRLAKTQDHDASSLLQQQLPTLELLAQDRIEWSTTKEVSCLSTLAQSADGSLDYLKLWVNGVPFYPEGEEPKAKDPSRWKKDWDIPLRYGMNLIKFQVYTKDGLASEEQVVNVYCQKPYVRPNLYVATISVSNYSDETMNLKYAVKDGRDLVSVFVNEEGRKTVGFPSRFGQVIVDSFYNERATKENIQAWRDKLLKTRPEDYVILYVSGHGLLDDSLDFWFATHDVDFKAPSKRGMSFEQLENLLIGIPAQQKLFLMDACHSGEVIKDELEVNGAFETPEGSKGVLVGYQYRGVEVVDLDGETVNRSDLKQELFSNYESRSGATVISAAAGNSFALESSEWSNGIFTYTVIGGLIYRWADLNDDGEVSVVELSKYVSSEVKRQTDGMQVPNDRQENIENNFRIW